MARVPILIFPAKFTKPFRFLTPFAKTLLSPARRSDMEAAGIEMEPEQYIIASIFSSLTWALLVFLLITLAQVSTITNPEEIGAMPVLVFLLMFIIFFVLHMIYPSILAKKMAEITDRQLIHVLRDMWVQSTSGIILYTILQNIARANYGAVSKELQAAVREISAGERDVIVLEKVATMTRSDAFKRVLWHIIASMRTGIGLTTALNSAVNILAADQRRAVREYGASLNFYLLMYLLFAAVVPAVLITFLSMLSIFQVLPLSIELLAAMVVGFIFLQFVVIGLMRVGRPEIT
ncbi:MAG: type II secretion system F family protein [Candidatus Micrarchaeia archaeon]